MKIGISCYPTYGGSGVIASELGMGLADRGHEVHFITYAVPGRLNVYKQGIYFHEVSVPEYPLFEYPPYSLSLASQMADCARSEGLQLIHSHYAIPHAASALLARGIVGNKLKVVTTLHGTDITLVGQNPSFLPVTKHSIENSDAVSTVSMFLRDEVCCKFTCDKHIEVIYNFINPGSCQNTDAGYLRTRFAPNGEKILVHVSNYRPLKRGHDVISIFLLLREKINVKLVLVGSGPELESMKDQVRRSNAERDLILLGNRENVYDILSAADVMLLPSQSESFGLVALEAMACRTPTIASNVGGLPEVIDHGITGFMAPVGDVEQMAGYALELFKDSELLIKLGKAAQESAFGRFNIETALDRYEELYESVVD